VQVDAKVANDLPAAHKEHTEAPVEVYLPAEHEEHELEPAPET
jgi:hypothetical protein